MPVIDPVGDLLARIRNAFLVGKDSLLVPHSKMKETVLKILEQHGYIEGFEVKEDKVLLLEIRLNPGAIEDLERISKPGRRIYASKQEIPRVKGGRGTVVISTSKGVMDGESARKEGLGGELLLKVW